MKLETLFLIIPFFCILMGACRSKAVAEKSLQIENLPDSIAKRYLDSMAKNIEESISWKKKGFPTEQRNTSYYEERPYYDSMQRLKKVTVYEFHSDTLTNYRHFYYWNDKLIAIRSYKMGSGKLLGALYYVFKNRRIIDSPLANNLSIPLDTILKQSSHLLNTFTKK